MDQVTTDLLDLVPPIPADAILAELDKAVVGQKAAKEALSTLVAMHLNWFHQADDLHAAPKALLLGPTGVGKTHTIQTVARLLRVPLVVVDATRLTPIGASSTDGLRLEDVFDELYSVAAEMLSLERAAARIKPLDLARRGIVFIDEFDKLRIEGRIQLPSNLVIQRTLLQLIEGAPVTLRGRSRAEGIPEVFDTRGVLFIASGAFEGIRDQAIRAKRPQEITRQLARPDAIVSSDIANYGFLPELIARLPVFVQFNELKPADLVAILNNPIVDPATVYRRYLASFGVNLVLTEDAKKYIADQATFLKMGARGLHQILFPVLSQLARELAESRPAEYALTAETIRSILNRL